jgi:dTDP-L-rhamnose 4-epimerase
VGSLGIGTFGARAGLSPPTHNLRRVSGERVLVTGGAGFIGSHLVDLLVADGREVRVLDCFHPAAHSRRPDYLNPAAELIVGDLADADVAARAVDGVDAVSHQASMVGLGQDFADVGDYAWSNDLATARLLAALEQRRFAGPLVLASSMVVYGEGGYECARHGAVRPSPRAAADLEAGRFEPPCPTCGDPLAPRSIGEDAELEPRSVYAATKLHQEHLCGLFARENPAVTYTALRYHNVYGPRMPRDTPYAGVASIFRSALAAGRAPRVFEDGRQRRDFVHVGDVAGANLAALGRRGGPAAFNVASGRPEPLLRMAELLADAAGPAAPRPEITGEFRLGDVRHVFADPARARAELGFAAAVDLATGMREFATAELR